ncbi:peroxisomal 2,4-dienoyl-CoA reductase [(3E)-enoyl-CoA-producing] isoform X1 [Hippopotamus amphibius kiboko]|uniref:peroxisomal 2,4-dienoyl-CoA reductase [(3E)-enoyl-CoA-producing] isoform X1 n=1 Tax=Hippopotamus amphibius kiboko TaxID=575201 RepID=UPI002595F932|nr:peroxisomal 2,4-dienoyl-CoA reductase [(3E)-enoyl-CoA-producing] isoform X1 [Hippopotamus amphibius kiboko]XP_057606747.1 peroxisomal 2,4-dienoyl-CoA reductase [(3E)-enoyl-CoA-producing] isoform X1 [Hippopotamus amphibius kiboko]XP_057606748.1 peroxisomal 2,4-dienoyl-CoA reductase [(3E)-enoyl-CoA-producing] isoform X1 [Hippopotamus amphibius kiboko]
MTKSLRRTISEMQQSLLTGLAFLPLTLLGTSVHISFTSSSTMLRCLSKASTQPRIFLLWQWMSTWVLFLTPCVSTDSGPVLNFSCFCSSSGVISLLGLFRRLMVAVGGGCTLKSLPSPPCCFGLLARGLLMGQQCQTSLFGGPRTVLAPSLCLGPTLLLPGAAGNFLCPASALSFNAFKTVMDIDTLGTFNVSRVLYEKFFRDHGGVIVNITATLGTRGQVLQVHAGSAKAAVDAMTRHLAVEWGPQNIRVNSLAPGPISGTEGFRRLGGPQAGMRAKVLASPLQRLGNKTEIAHSALFLASPLASYVTGALLVVDGGTWLTVPNDIQLLAGFSSAKL